MKTNENLLIGKRLRSARMQLGFSRRKFAEICGFSAATLQAWEDGKYPPPLRSIVKYVESLFQCGLMATPEWFVNGQGLPPRLINTHIIKGRSKEEVLLKEILFFENENTITTHITDDSMLPFYANGDVLGGVIVPPDQITKHTGTICLVTIASGEHLARKIKIGTEAQRYHLLSTNLNTDVPNAFLLNQEIIQLGQIIWHRKVVLL